MMEDSDEEDDDIPEKNEAQSLYDVISYNVLTDEHSTSVCLSDSYYDSMGDTDSSAGTALSNGNNSSNAHLSPRQRRQQSELEQQRSPPNNRRSRLSYMGYVPVSPNTAAAMAMMEQVRESTSSKNSTNDNGNNVADKSDDKSGGVGIDIVDNNNENNSNNTSNKRNSSNGSNGSSSGRTIGGGTCTTGATFPSIKVDDTSTTRRRQRQFTDEMPVDEQQEHQHHQQRSSLGSVMSSPGSTITGGGADSFSVNAAVNIAEYISPDQQRLMEEHQQQQQQQQQGETTTTSNRNHHPSSNTASSSVHEQSRVEDSTTITSTSVESSVMPNSYTGHPGMTMTNNNNNNNPHNNRHYHGNGAAHQPHSKQNIHEYQPLSPVVASPSGANVNVPAAALLFHHHQGGAFVASPTTPNINNTQQHVNNEVWAERNEIKNEHSSPVLSTPRQKQQQQQGILDGMSPPSLNHPDPPNSQQHNTNNQDHHNHAGSYYQQQEQQKQYPAQSFQQQQQHYHLSHLYPYGMNSKPQSSGFTPRNPVLARQLQAFHLYHNQQQEQEQEQQQQQGYASKEKAAAKINNDKVTPSSIERCCNPVTQEKDEATQNSTSDDHMPFLICGPDGPKFRNVKFVSPAMGKKLDDEISRGSISYHGALDEVGIKCQNMVTTLFTTCGSIVTHGYHIDGKSSVKQKRSKFEKVADQSIARMVPPPCSEIQLQQQMHRNTSNEEENNDGKANDTFTANAKKILYAGNNMMSNLPKDFQNLAQSATYHNVFDTFQRYYEPGKEEHDDPEGILLSKDSDGNGIREALSDDPDEQQAAKQESQQQQLREQQRQQLQEQQQYQQQQQKQQQKREIETVTRDLSVPTSPLKSSTSVSEGKISDTPRSPIAMQRDLFKKLRARRRNRSRSPIRRTSSAPDLENANSPKVRGEQKEKVLEASYDTERFKTRYSRNIFSKLHDDSKEEALDDEPEDTSARSQDKDSFHASTEDKSDSSLYSWATPQTHVESSKDSLEMEDDDFASVRENESLELLSSISKSMESAQEDQGEEEGTMIEEVLMTTSSSGTMSESLVGSDVDDDAQLDCIISSSLSEEERQESQDDIDGMLLDSFEHTEFPHTPLDIIEEGSTEGTEEDTAHLASIKNDIIDIVSESGSGEFSIDNRTISSIDGKNVNDVDEAALSTLIDDETTSETDWGTNTKHSIFSVIVLLRLVFLSTLFFQCGAMVSVWDQVADHMRKIEGGSQAIKTTETFVSNFKTRGTSLVASAKQIINIERSLEDIFLDIQTSASSWLDTANLLSKLESAATDEEKWDDVLSPLERRRNAYQDIASMDQEFLKEFEQERKNPPTERRESTPRTDDSEQKNMQIETTENPTPFLDDIEQKRTSIETVETGPPVDGIERKRITTERTESPPLVDDITLEKKSELETFHQLVHEALRTPDVDKQRVRPAVAEMIVPAKALPVAEKSEWVQELEEALEGVAGGEQQ